MTTPTAGDASPNDVLGYAGRGWGIFPVWRVNANGSCQCGKNACGNVGKHPLGTAVPNGCLDATTDRAVVASWQRRYPHAHWAIATGPESGLVVLDVDPQHGGSTTVAELERAHGQLPDTVTCKTGGSGTHYYFQWPSNGAHVKNSEGGDGRPLGKGVDVRGWHGYVIAPPSGHVSGGTYGWAQDRGPGDVALAELPPWLLDLMVADSHQGADGDNGRKAPGWVADTLAGLAEGHRDVDLTKVAGKLRRGGLDAAEIETLLAPHAERASFPLSDLRKLAGSIGAKPRAYHHTDLGNAERFVDANRGRVRYCHAWKTWLIWNGRRWQRDTDGGAERLAKECILGLYGEAGKLDDAERKRLVAHAVRSEAAERIRAMLVLARSEPGVPVSPGELDSDLWLFNCGNGTVNLHTGKLQLHNSADLITRMAPVPYEPNARLPLWDAFTADVCGGDPDLDAFLQRVMGAALCGVPEEEIYFVYGPKLTGKTTLLEAVGAAFGDYAATADISTFLLPLREGAPRPDVVRLVGTRLVKAEEASHGSKLGDGLLKKMTGGATVTVRTLYEKEIEFKPTFTPIFASNVAPQAPHDDDAFWRRMVRIPFNHLQSSVSEAQPGYQAPAYQSGNRRGRNSGVGRQRLSRMAATGD